MMVCASSEEAELTKMMNNEQGKTKQLRTAERTVAQLKKGSISKARKYFCKFEHGQFTGMKKFGEV